MAEIESFHDSGSYLNTPVEQDGARWQAFVLCLLRRITVLSLILYT